MISSAKYSKYKCFIFIGDNPYYHQYFFELAESLISSSIKTVFICHSSLSAYKVKKNGFNCINIASTISSRIRGSYSEEFNFSEKLSAHQNINSISLSSASRMLDNCRLYLNNSTINSDRSIFVTGPELNFISTVGLIIADELELPAVSLETTFDTRLLTLKFNRSFSFLENDHSSNFVNYLINPSYRKKRVFRQKKITDYIWRSARILEIIYRLIFRLPTLFRFKYFAVKLYQEISYKNPFNSLPCYSHRPESRPFILVLLNTPYVKKYYFSTESYLRFISSCVPNGFDVVVRPHPAECYHNLNLEESSFSFFYNSSDYSISELLAKCSAVVTPNSSSVFDAIYHKKPVFFSASSYLLNNNFRLFKYVGCDRVLLSNYLKNIAMNDLSAFELVSDDLYQFFTYLRNQILVTSDQDNLGFDSLKSRILLLFSIFCSRS